MGDRRKSDWEFFELRKAKEKGVISVDEFELLADMFALLSQSDPDLGEICQHVCMDGSRFWKIVRSMEERGVLEVESQGIYTRVDVRPEDQWRHDAGSLTTDFHWEQEDDAYEKIVRRALYRGAITEEEFDFLRPMARRAKWSVNPCSDVQAGQFRTSLYMLARWHGMSTYKVRKKLRSLHERGVIRCWSLQLGTWIAFVEPEMVEA